MKRNSIVVANPATPASSPTITNAHTKSTLRRLTAWIAYPRLARPGGGFGRVPIGPHTLEAAPEQVDHQLGRLVDVGITGTEPGRDRLAGPHQRDRHHLEVSIWSGIPGARLQQPGDQGEDPLTSLAHGVGERLRAGGLGVHHDPRRAFCAV